MKSKSRNMKGFFLFNWKFQATKYFEDPCCFQSSFWGVIFLPTLTKGVFIWGSSALQTRCLNNSSRGRGWLLPPLDWRLLFLHILDFWITFGNWQWECSGQHKLSSPAYIVVRTIYQSDEALSFFIPELMGLARLNPPYHSFNRVLCAQHNTNYCHGCRVWWGRGEQDEEVSHGRERENIHKSEEKWKHQFYSGFFWMCGKRRECKDREVVYERSERRNRKTETVRERRGCTEEKEVDCVKERKRPRRSGNNTGNEKSHFLWMKKEEERQRQTSGLCKVKKDIQGESETRMNSRMERNETEKRH